MYIYDSLNPQILQSIHYIKFFKFNWRVISFNPSQLSILLYCNLIFIQHHLLIINWVWNFFILNLVCDLIWNQVIIIWNLIGNIHPLWINFESNYGVTSSVIRQLVLSKDPTCWKLFSSFSICSCASDTSLVNKILRSEAVIFLSHLIKFSSLINQISKPCPILHPNDFLYP